MALTGEITGSILASMSASGGVNGEIAFDGSGTDNYNELDNKPSINGVILEGNKTSSDLNIETGGTDNYNELLNKPKINGILLTGDVSDTQLQINYNHLINKPVIPDISEIETRLDTAETDIDNINDEIATIKATDLTQNADINSLKNRVNGTETNISNLTNRVSSAESSITTQGTQISSIEDNVSSLDTRVGTSEGDIDTLQGDMTQAQSDISELNSSLMQKSTVIPNPTGTPSDTLSTVSIDGNIFGIKGIGIKQLSVTENGTYSEEGIAYSPVIVNVPAPDNAYLLNEVEGLPKDIATFTDGASLPMPTLKVGIEPVQEGSGDPSPENIRPISGHTEANVVVSPTTDTEDGTTYNIQFKDGDNPLTVYGGTLDVVSGVLTVDRLCVTYSDTDKKKNSSFRLYPAPSNALVTNADSEQPSPLFICDKYKFMSIAEIVSTTAENIGIGISKTSTSFYIKDTAMLQMTLEEAQTYLSSHPIDVVYPLATPIAYQLTPTQVKSLLGTNNVWADTGDIEELEYFSKEA
jgi:archaellum component FlaC